MSYDLLLHPKECVSSFKRTQLAHRVGFDVGEGHFGAGRDVDDIGVGTTEIGTRL